MKNTAATMEKAGFDLVGNCQSDSRQKSNSNAEMPVSAGVRPRWSRRGLHFEEMKEEAEDNGEA